MRLDTLPSMTGAIALHRQAGFVPIDLHNQTPGAGTLFLGRRLEPLHRLRAGSECYR
jgi:hypothetical protein